MYKSIILLCMLMFSCLVFAEELDVNSAQPAYESYSYTLMDELKLNTKNYNKANINKKLARNKIVKPKDKVLTAKTLAYFSIYSEEFQDILDVSKPGEGSGGMAQYTLGNFSARLNYERAEHKKDKVDSATLHIDYNLAPGISPYIETKHLRGVGANNLDFNDKRLKRATLFLIGTKIEF